MTRERGKNEKSSECPAKYSEGITTLIELKFTEVKNLKMENEDEAEMMEEIIEEEKNYEEVYECSECNMTFEDFDDHMKTYHGDEREENKYELLEDVALHESEEEVPMAFVIKNANGMFECSECSQTYKSLNRYLSHVKIHGTVVDENVKKLEEHLRKIDETRTSYEEIQSEDDPAKKLYRCRVCQTEFDARKKFLLHYPIHRNVSEAQQKNKKAVKASSKLFHCKLCNRTVSNEHEMAMHMNAHVENSTMGSRSTEPIEKKTKTRGKGEGSSMYPCQYCGKEFKRPHEKVKHERTHTGEKPYSCDICGKSFRVTYCLSLHKKNVHSDERPYVCSFENCNKRFKSQSVYNHHLNTHGTAKNYKCPFCGKAFKTSVQLAGHKNTHTKPFSCNVCSRAFASLYAVKIHMEVHKNLETNLKYVCKICNAQYGRSFALTDHMKTAHEGTANLEPAEEHYIIEETESQAEVEESEEVYSVVMVSK